MSLELGSQTDPFIIIYNHRKPSKTQPEPRKTKRRHHDYSTLPHSIIITRRMAAELQHQIQHTQNQPESEQIPSYSPKSAQEEPGEDINFFDDQDLDRCIPMGELPQEDFPYNLHDPSLSSNYSKLERTLYAMGTTAYEEDLSQAEH